ncbi:hypothetical protein BCIN_01g03960 [Botrytis cinerea B05.10]|uniref:Uncharacterized protein n=2 Tax=Botryotinia fuckeliana TaxID=40559 RepID=A0A384J520_BOTFB|nr:hypothetical protein BCIN_01g03960 [Botrytis cinerea B05.10]ATZ45651.1 hypothetical protein BCIN_01g03960 [Botrytis cinerea B05.10]
MPPTHTAHPYPSPVPVSLQSTMLRFPIHPNSPILAALKSLTFAIGLPISLLVYPIAHPSWEMPQTSRSVFSRSPLVGRCCFVLLFLNAVSFVCLVCAHPSTVQNRNLRAAYDDVRREGCHTVQ